MIQIYCGDGKGKTTAAIGLAVRAAGRGNPVVIAQFLKSADSGERLILGKLSGVTLLEIPDEMKFVFAELERRADYITEMKKRRHPFDQGQAARKGIEW